MHSNLVTHVTESLSAVDIAALSPAQGVAPIVSGYSHRAGHYLDMNRYEATVSRRAPLVVVPNPRFRTNTPETLHHVTLRHHTLNPVPSIDLAIRRTLRSKLAPYYCSSSSLSVQDLRISRARAFHSFDDDGDDHDDDDDDDDDGFDGEMMVLS